MSAVTKKFDETQKPTDRASLPNSQRVYIDGTQPGVRVPFREITQNSTRNFDGTLTENAPVRVYDTSGTWGDPDLHCEVSDGLPLLRREWILGRGDVEEYEGREQKPIGKLEDFPALRRAPLRAKSGACVTQMHYARLGIITPEMEFIAIRENLGREHWDRESPRDSVLHQHKGQSFS